MGWEEPEHRQWLCVARQWSRLSSLSDTRVNKRVFNWAREHANLGHRNWVLRVQGRCREAGIDPAEVHLWSHRQIGNKLQGFFKERTQTNFANELNRTSARNGRGLNKLRTYRTFKTLFETEPYVQNVNNRARRRALAQLRCGVAPIRLETGRYERGRYLPVEERTCYVCKNAVESELHVVIQCPLYQDLRDDLFYMCQCTEPLFAEMSDQDKLRFILGPTLERSNYSAKLLFEMLKRRRCMVFNV